MLINNFFKILNFEQTEGSILATIKINATHPIFKGHFPNKPVTPGVVQIQIVKEILENICKQNFLLKEMGRCKFLAVLNPTETPEINVKINYSLTDEGITKVSTQGNTKDGVQTFFKFTAKYV